MSKSGNGMYYSYRCIRNLGIDVNDTETNPQDLVDFKGSGFGPYTFDLSRMNPKSLREFPVPDKQATHTHDQDINRPYIKFEMKTETRNARGEEPDYSWGSFNDNSWRDYQNSNNACPSGYRVPNQRELLIMSTRLPDDAWAEFETGRYSSTKVIYMSYTEFALNNRHTDYEYREGFMYDAESKIFTLQHWVDLGLIGYPKESGYVRCIQDIDPQP